MSVRDTALGAPPQNSSSTRTEGGRGHRHVVTGSVVMLAGSVLVALSNFGYNIGVAHILGPGDFSQAAAAVTLLMLASCLHLAFQLVTAKLIARNADIASRAATYQHLLRRSWLAGLALSAVIIGFSRAVANYLRMPSPMLVALLGLGMLFYIPLGVRRGALQGSCQFWRLSLNLSAEAFLKLAAALALIFAGAGVLGAVAAIPLSVIAAFLLPGGTAEFLQPTAQPAVIAFRESLQAILFFVGQVLISNIDILMVKHFFSPADAGVYAAVALVGRLLYFAAWSVTSAMFPFAASAPEEHESRRVLAIPLLLVASLSAAFAVFLASFPGFVLRTLFGDGFHRADVGALLTMNAVATGVYAMAVVLITYEMSRRLANTGWLQMVAALLVIAGVSRLHASLMQVIVVQAALRILLLLAVARPFFRTPSACAAAPEISEISFGE